MDSSAADDAVDPRGSSDVAVADLPSTSGAHWANRDNAALRERRDDGRTPFRRPPAVNSFPDGGDDPGGSWFVGRNTTPADNPGRPEPDPTEPELAAPGFGPTPATPSRASYGFSAGPISPSGWAAATPDATASIPAPPARGANTTRRPHRAAHHVPASHGPEPRNAPQPAAPRRRSPTVVASGIALATLLLLGGFALFLGLDDGLLGPGKTATAPLGGRTEAVFELVAAVTTVTVKAQDLGDDLYQITSADDSGTAPSPVLTDDRVQLHLAPDGDGASGRVDVLLSSKVRWALRFVGGANEQSVDLTGGRVGSIDVIGGSRRCHLSLPVPAGTIPVRVTGGVEDLSITSPKASPVRVRVDGGAKTVAVGGRTLRDVRPGSTLTPKGWQVRNRYDMDAAARITLLSVHAK